MKTATSTAKQGVVDPDVVALSVTDSMINIDHQLHHVPAKTALELIEFCRRRLDASESRILADRYEKGASDRDVEDLAKGSDGKTSKAAAKKKARRAKATNANAVRRPQGASSLTEFPRCAPKHRPSANRCRL